MSLATRCPQCSAVSQADQDQLTASDGMVRCGRCHHVYTTNPHRLTEDGQRIEPVLSHVPETLGQMTSLQKEQIASLPFIKQADSFCLKGRIRTGCIILILTLLVSLIAQIIHYRNDLISYIPSARPLLAQMAKPFGLSVNYPISFAPGKELTIDASSFSMMPDGSYLLEVNIRNRGAYALAIPHLELSLQNTAGDIVMRKILTPEALGISQPSISPHQELFIQQSIRVNIQDSNGIGYLIKLLYL